MRFEWDTNGVVLGTYLIEIRAIPVEGELDTHDNACNIELRILLVLRYVGGEITGVTLAALIIALKRLISPIITVIVIMMVVAATIASALSAYIIYKRTKKKRSSPYSALNFF